MEAGTETLDDDIVIVGSGPAGVSAAWPMVEAGLRVRMLDAGERPVHQPPTGTIATFRASPDRWMQQFGADFGGLRPGNGVSPKAATPNARSILASFRDFADLETSGFFPFAGLGAGGLSAIWGALTAHFDEQDFSEYPIALADMQPSYDAVSERMGVTAGGSPFRQPVAPHLRRILERFFEDGPGPGGVRMRPAENAVLGHAMNGRDECVRCGLCLWGCHRGSIYDSAADLGRLRQRPNFAFEAGALVRRLLPSAAGHLLQVQSGERVRMVHMPRLMLAAGTLATTALVFDRLGHVGVPTPLLNNPVAAMASVAPRMFARDLPDECFSLAQIFFEIPLADGEAAAGALYSADGLPLDVFASRLPFTRPTSLRLARLLAPALVLATCYLPSRYSRNTITVRWNGDRLALAIEGGTTAAARTALKTAKRRLAADLRRLGALPLPGGFAIGAPGSDAHYAGTVPMRRAGEAGKTPSCDGDGEVNGVPGLFVVDGAALPSLSARHCTLTIMANADRIGRKLVASHRL